MNPQDLINRSRNSSVVSFHKFVLLHRKYSGDLFCFYEGKDSQYYFPRICQNYGDNHHPIICGNKKAVIETYNSIKSKYGNFKTAFFVDSDFDDKINIDDIYSTPCYSIENLYCSEIVLIRILKNEFMLKETDYEFIKIIELYKENQKLFHESTALFNVWYATLKQKAKSNNTIPNVNLNDKFPRDFITIKIGEIKSNYDLKKIKQKYSGAIDVNESEIEKTLASFYSIEHRKKNRGKYEIQFFLEFLKFLINDSRNDKIILKSKTKFNVDIALILTQLCQYAETPDCLVDYIKNCA